MMAATTGHIIYFGNIYCMTRLLFFQFHKFWLPCHGKNNRSESLSGHLPKLELEYLEVLLFLVAAVTECYVKKKKSTRTHPFYYRIQLFKIITTIWLDTGTGCMHVLEMCILSDFCGN
jgi:hypothetical protein